jgi:two-component system alkaline phosphatase synthesis response regulator PhoP
MSFLNNLKGLYGNKQTPQTDAPTQTTVQKKLLVVEDEKLLADALEIKFKNAGFMVFRATNGQEGLESAVANKPDIVLLDILMPQMDGKEMLSKLREIPEFKSLPVVVLTNAGTVENIHEMKFYDNASEFLIKSNVTPEDILQKVNALVH